jgi:eukaryotic-like serine/threonine-protein kinase
MSLSSGQSLTHYEVLGPLGAGGMGEVYRARDTRLEREVAIKVLPAELADDEERLRRFEREAKTLASLNHPNVAGIHGVDRDGEHVFLALELVPGEDLGERLKRGALPVDEALEICRQIAEGLEAAHEAGVIHRDLKPANVRVTPDGVVKILDFGLAKPIHPKATTHGTSAAESDSFLMTEEGLVLGTPTYMSPEQARGKPVDRRTDLWAFGCVMFECLTGKRAFGGDSMTDVLASIVGEDPNWDLLPALPPRVHELLRRTFAKNPRERLRDAGEARVQLELARSEEGGVPATTDAADAAGSGGGRRALTLLVGVLALAGGYALRSATAPAHVSLDADEPAAPGMAVVLAETDEMVTDLELSPDGTRLAWAQPSGVYIRSLDSFDLTVVRMDEAGSLREEPYCLAWSPDSAQVAFTTPEGLWRVDADGDHLTLVTRDRLVQDTHAQLDWSSDGLLVYSDGTSLDLLGRSFLVDRTTPIYSADEARTMHFDGIHILPDDSMLAVRHRVGINLPDTFSLLRDGVMRDVLELPGWNLSGPAYSNGSLVFDRKDTTPDSIWHVALDLETGEVLGDPRQVIQNGSLVTLVGDTLAYVVPDAPTGLRAVWVDLDGSMGLIPGLAASDMMVASLSYDGRHLYAGDVFAGGDVLRQDLASGEQSSVTKIEPGTVVLSDLPDGRLVTFDALGGPAPETYSLTPSGAREVLCEGLLTCTSRDGRKGLVVQIDEHGKPSDVELIDLAGDAAPVSLGLQSAWTQIGFSPGDLSPDGRWALFSAAEGLSSKIVVASTSGDGTNFSVVAGTGKAAWFDSSGEAIYYWTASERRDPPGLSSTLWRVAWRGADEPALGDPEKLFELDDPVMVTGFDHERGRFLAMWRQTEGKHRILARTKWSE